MNHRWQKTNVNDKLVMTRIIGQEIAVREMKRWEKLYYKFSPELPWLITYCLMLIAALGLGIYAGHKVTVAYKDTELIDLQAQLETANASLAEAAIELAQYRQGKERMIAWAGLVSYYADAHHGKQTASGAKFDMNSFTAAHRALPFGSLVLVLDVRRFTWVLVEITDRGPADWTGRDIDLSRAAARQLGMERDGVIPALMLTVKGRPSEGD